KDDHNKYDDQSKEEEKEELDAEKEEGEEEKDSELISDSVVFGSLDIGNDETIDFNNSMNVRQIARLRAQKAHQRTQDRLIQWELHSNNNNTNKRGKKKGKLSTDSSYTITVDSSSTSTSSSDITDDMGTDDSYSRDDDGVEKENGEENELSSSFSEMLSGHSTMRGTTAKNSSSSMILPSSSSCATSSLSSDSDEPSTKRVGLPQGTTNTATRTSSSSSSSSSSSAFSLSGSNIALLTPPPIFSGVLKHYQLEGFTWLVSLFDNGMNGILADDMGTGKTVQTIAFLSFLYFYRGVYGPFLIVTPTSTCPNWVYEIQRFCPTFKVCPYWGSPVQRKGLRKLWNYGFGKKSSLIHIIVTSYPIVVKDEALFSKIKWCMIVCDEAQALKGTSSQRWTVLTRFKCRNRLLLSGTPIQNDLTELWALLHFIMPDLFDNLDQFIGWFCGESSARSKQHGSSSEVTAGGGAHSATTGGTTSFSSSNVDKFRLSPTQLSHLKNVLKPFMLRRVKDDVEKEIGSKKIVSIECPFTPLQRQMYFDLQKTIPSGSILSVLETIPKFDDALDDETLLAASSSSSSSSSVLASNLKNVLVQLQKVCNHPFLFFRPDRIEPVRMSYKIPQSVDRFKFKISTNSKYVSSDGNEHLRIDARSEKRKRKMRKEKGEKPLYIRNEKEKKYYHHFDREEHSILGFPEKVTDFLRKRGGKRRFRYLYESILEEEKLANELDMCFDHENHDGMVQQNDIGDIKNSNYNKNNYSLLRGLFPHPIHSHPSLQSLSSSLHRQLQYQYRNKRIASAIIPAFFSTPPLRSVSHIIHSGDMFIDRMIEREIGEIGGREEEEEGELLHIGVAGMKDEGKDEYLREQRDNYNIVGSSSLSLPYGDSASKTVIITPIPEEETTHTRSRRRSMGTKSSVTEGTDGTVYSDGSIMEEDGERGGDSGGILVEQLVDSDFDSRGDVKSMRRGHCFSDFTAIVSANEVIAPYRDLSSTSSRIKTIGSTGVSIQPCRSRNPSSKRRHLITGMNRDDH
ncbi:Chromatin-remodeling ATPase INO80, partial [Aduncisulcus paluster]